MSKQIDSLCDSLKAQLNAVDTRLQAAKSSLESLPGKSEQAMLDNIDQLRASFKTEKDRFKRAKETLKSEAADAAHLVKESIDDWQTKRESAKLSQRADKAEEKATDAVGDVLAMFNIAEEAILEAVIARAQAIDDTTMPVAAAS